MDSASLAAFSKTAKFQCQGYKYGRICYTAGHYKDL